MGFFASYLKKLKLFFYSDTRGLTNITRHLMEGEREREREKERERERET
jgi:hypothetical protein